MTRPNRLSRLFSANGQESWSKGSYVKTDDKLHTIVFFTFPNAIINLIYLKINGEINVQSSRRWKLDPAVATAVSKQH